MTDKEFKRLSRAQLIDIIYQLQLENDELTQKNKALEAALEDKRLRMDNAGNLAEAALEMNDFFRSAQNAAEHYLNEIKTIREEAATERERILEEARSEAAQILTRAKKTQGDYDLAIKAILEEYQQSNQTTGDTV